MERPSKKEFSLLEKYRDMKDIASLSKIARTLGIPVKHAGNIARRVAFWVYMNDEK